MVSRSVSRFIPGIFWKIAIGIVLFTLISSTAFAATASLADEMLNPTLPDYYDVEGPHRFTENESRAEYPRMLVDADDNLHVIWHDTRNDPTPGDTEHNFEIFYKKYDKDGNLMVDDTRTTDATNLSYKPYGWYVQAPSVGLDSDGNIHLAYIDYTKNTYAYDNRPNAEIYYMKFYGGLDEGGESADRADLVLVDETRISVGPAHSGDPDLTMDSQDNVHIIWYDHRSAWWNWELYYSKLSKSGEILIDQMRLTYYNDYDSGPEIAADSEDNIQIVFRSHHWDTGLNDLYFMKLDNYGNILINYTKFYGEDVPTVSRGGKVYPLLVVDSDDNAHVIWNDESNSSNNEIYYLKLDSEGNWLMDEPLRLTYTANKSSINDIAIDPNGRIYIGWQDLTPAYPQIYMAILNSDGSYHLQPYQITITDSTSHCTHFTFDSRGYIHVAWDDRITGYAEIYHILLKPYILKLAFVPTGTPGAEVDVTVNEEGEAVSEFTVIRESGNPKLNAVIVDIEINFDFSYELELEYDGTGTKGKNANGAVPMKVYLVEDGKLSKQLTNTVVNSNSGKNPKHTATLDLDDVIADYFA